MERPQVFKTLVGILKQFVKDAALLDGAKDETRIVDDLDINSARLIDIVLKVEDEYDIELDDEVLNNLKTVGHAVDAILAEKSKAS